MFKKSCIEQFLPNFIKYFFVLTPQKNLSKVVWADCMALCSFTGLHKDFKGLFPGALSIQRKHTFA